MDKNKELGREGEKFAHDYLANNDYIILEKNYRCRFGEVDLIAKKGRSVVFIEVKTRRSTSYGDPEESVDSLKIRKIRNTANHYISNKKLYGFEICFDVISLKIAAGSYLLKHIKNAF